MSALNGHIKAFFKSEHGNAIFLIMIAIFLLGMLAKIMVERNSDTAAIASSTNKKIQTHQIISRAMNMRNAATKIVDEGIAAGNIDDVDPSDAVNYQAGDHRPKLYHPYGGGIQYHEDYKGWTTILIHKNAAVTDVGPSSTAEIMAVGSVNQTLCGAINNKLYGDPAIPMLTLAAINALKDGSTAVTLDEGTTCSGLCDGRAHQCVRDPNDIIFVYYHTLYPR